MQEHRDGEDRLRRSSSVPDRRDGAASASRLEEVGDLHFHAATYGSALEYYRSALRVRAASVAEPTPEFVADELRLRLKAADCYRLQGLYPEANEQLDLCRELAEPLGAIEEARVDVRLAAVLRVRGKYEDAIALARKAFGVLCVTDRHHDVTIAQMVLGVSHACTGQPVKAEEFFQDALATYRRIGDVVSQAHVLNNLALLAKQACRWTRALQLYDRAEELFRRHGATYALCQLHVNKAVVHRKTGQTAEALATALRGLQLARDLGAQAELTRLHLLLGQIQIAERKFPESEQHLLEAKVYAERQDAQRELALADEFLGDLMAAQGRTDEARVNYELAEARARRISESNDILAEVLRRVAELEFQVGDLEKARRVATRGLDMVERSGEEYERGFLLRIEGLAAAGLDDVEAALEALEESVACFRRLRLNAELAQSLRDLAEVHLATGEAEHLLLSRGRLHEALRIEDQQGGGPPCSTHLLMARVELALGNADDALISLFEIERLNCHGDPVFDEEADALRREIEAHMAHQAQSVSGSHQALSELPDRLSSDELPRREELGTVLGATAARLGAQRAFVAVRAESGRIDVLAVHELTRQMARSLAGQVFGLLGDSEAAPRVWSNTVRDPEWPDERRPKDAAVAFPLLSSDRKLQGVFFFDADLGIDHTLPFDSDSLGMASTYVELLRTSLLRSDSELAVEDFQSGPFARVITQSEKVMEVLNLCSKVARSPYTVLFTGETGTGKGLLARLIHQLSPRENEAFVSVNCAAMPETLLESELFGHVKGAFTGADREKEGLIVSAQRGTLFLDEIGKMSLPMQAKLLQFLDDKEVRPVGGNRAVAVDTRVLCATKSDLRQMVERGEFLEDLYYRLLDFPIVVPPLRERGDDVLLLAEHFIQRTAAELQRPVPSMTRAFATKLRGHRWPGNVRELEKTLRRAVLLAADEERLKDVHLPDEVREGADLPAGDELHDDLRPLREQVSDLERHVLQASLDRLGWNRAEAARQLKISYPTLLQKIRLYKLRPPEEVR